MTGGNGGNGGAGNSSNDASGGGGGGAGGYGAVYLGSSLTLDSAFTIKGGNGGRGGNGAIGAISDGGGGGGGDGGIGLHMLNPVSGATIAGTVVGGNGGLGGNGTSSSAAGDGGDGGVGLLFDSTAVVTISGSVRGGDGANAGTQSVGGSAGTNGAGGVGIIGEGLSVTIETGGTVSGGLDGGSGTRANAIEFTGGTNRLTVYSAPNIIGNVVAGGMFDTFEIGGTTNGSFNVSFVGPATQFRGFEAFEKSGNGTWTLNGTTTEKTPWTILAGTLSISNGAVLGASSGTLTLNGGTLRVSNSTTVLNPISVGSGNGAVNVAAAMSVSAQGAVSGTGTLTKSGAGLMSLTADNSAFGGSTNVSGGVLEVYSGLGGNIAVGSELRLIQNSARTFSGTFSGTGTISKQGSGTTMLSGDSSAFAGSTTISSGALTVSGALGGDIDIATAGTLRLDQATDRTFSGALTGDGVLTKQGSATTTLSGDASGYTGPATIASGTLRVSNAFGGNVNIGVFGTFELDQSSDRTFGGMFVGTGALTKTGSGVSILSANSALYSGTTTISGGSLLVNGTLGGTSSSVQVASGGTLGGTGILGGSVTVQSGGTLSPGASPGTLTVNGDLTLSAGSTTRFELNTPNVSGGATNDFVSVGGNLALGGTLEAQVASAGFYNLFGYAGALSGSFGTVNVTGVPGTTGTVITGTPAQVNLVVVGSGQQIQFWDGANTAANAAVDGGTGTWDASANNWTSSDGTMNLPWLRSVGVFAGTAGTVTVAGTQAFDTLQFKTDGYQLTGGTLSLSPGSGSAGTVNVDGGVTTTIASTIADGTATRLSKQGSGTLVLTGVNSYTGGTTIGAGTLQVATDAALGAASGGLALDGGTLSTTTTFDTARAITLSSASGGFAPAAGTTLTLSGTVTGSGALGVSGAGTLTLAGATSYTGGTNVSSGTLVGDTGSIRGDIANAGTVEFAQSADGTFAGDIGGLGGSDGQMVKSGAGTLTLTGASSLRWSIEQGSVVSTTQLFTGDVMVAAGTNLTFDQAFDGTYGGVVTGAGDILYTGGGLVRLTGDNSAYAGETTVQDFTMTLGGTTLGGNLELGSGGRLAGNGTVGSTLVKTGGAIAPGNSPGTINVAGNLVFQTGSIYEVETDPGSAVSDLIQVTGTATLGGRVMHVGLNGTYAPNSSYTILTAAGGVSGTFEGVSSALAFLDPTLVYGANSVTLQLVRNDTAFADLARSANQRAVAVELENLGAGNAVFDAVAGLDRLSAPAAFDALSGEIHASLKTGLIADSRFVRDAALDRARAVSRGACLARSGGAGEGATAAEACGSGDGLGAWVQGFGAFGSFDTAAAGLDTRTGGVMVGGDAAIGDTGLAGLVAGYQASGYRVDGLASKADASSFFVGVYGGAALGSFNLTGGAAYAWSDVDTARTAAFAGFSERLGAATHAGTAQVFGELGYEFDTGPAVFEPFAGLAHISVSSDGYTETGGASALSIASGTTDMTFSTLGIRASALLPFGDAGAARLTGMVGWRHAYGSATPGALNAFAGGTPFAVTGASVGEDVALLSAGLNFDLGARPEMGLENTDFSISYDGQFGSGVAESAFTAKLKLKF
ncbi:autotransporter domain-containing protein [Hoeflea olei]|uniref:Autotransporter domain-containing protein n=1 Tax=Hoeflea olei TaxID=1480615 RepID=A0A1C1YQ89_9HYPH|nr:autotransporter domain-containing protein [Hoeflea olei]OCW55723.1 hypothetical protein AWJ14_14650 [Hoeflea olei]